MSDIDNVKLIPQQQWKLRNGAIVTLRRSKVEDAVLPWVGTDEFGREFRFNAMGRCIVNAMPHISFDLVEFIPETKPQTIDFKIGDRWIIRSGDIVTCIRLNATGGAYFHHIGEYFVSSLGRCKNNPMFDLMHKCTKPSSDKPHSFVTVDEANGKTVTVSIPSKEDLNIRMIEEVPGYEKLIDVLEAAYKQASQGKGKERHGGLGAAFEDQPMATINKQLGSTHGFIYQAHKKSLEAMRLPTDRAQAEILGAINYLAGAYIAMGSWAKKS
jgi:hypothetical protein